jgi:hypothetical protein
MTIVKLSIQGWSKEQKFAVARVTAQALTLSAPILGESWSCQLWYDLLSYLNVSQQDLESRVLSFQEAVELISNENRDIRIEALVDILALTLHITDIEEEKKKDVVMVYDARSRRFLVELEHLLNLHRGDLTAVENSVAQQMYYALLDSQNEKKQASKKGENSSSALMQQNMDLSAQKAMTDSNKKKNAFRWLATGVGIIGGGAVIGKEQIKHHGYAIKI